MEQPPTPDLIDQFMARYRREFDFFEQAGRIVAQQLEARLESSGIRAMVTSRAKNPKRLEAKVRQRAAKAQYVTVDDVYGDIVDLAGVRVALYFPGERPEVDKIIQEQFLLTEAAKVFKGSPSPSYEKRFSGYWATHYRLQIREATLSETSQRFAIARVEVQVASVLMHAWSEVEHDLVYKPMQGALSEDELAILDELNGMMLAGEIALERLQRAAKTRLSVQGARFENHYDLASFLLEFGRARLGNADAEPVLGDAEKLFRLLVSLDISRAEQLRPYLESVSLETEQRPLAQQIIDQILAADPDRYAAYAAVRSDGARFAPASHINLIQVADQPVPDDEERELGAFMKRWIMLERFLRELSLLRDLSAQDSLVAFPKLVKWLDVFDPHEKEEIEQIRRVRNSVVHGKTANADPGFIREHSQALSRIFGRLAADPRPDVQQAIRRTLGDEGRMP